MKLEELSPRNHVKIKWCPFCRKSQFRLDVVSVGKMRIGCLTCGALGPVGHTKNRAIVAWNAGR